MCRDMLSDKQKKLFEDFRITVDSEELYYLSDNHLLRFLKAYKWDLKETLRQLKKCEEMRSGLNCNHMNRHEFADLF